MESVDYRGVVPLVPLAPLVLLPLGDVLEPERCDEEPLGEVLLLPGVLLELPGVLRLPPNVELPEAPELPLMPLCELLVPGAPTLLLDPLWLCCIAMVRVRDSTICSKRATRASNEPEPLILLPPLNVPLLVELPSVPEPPTEEDCPRPPLDCEVVPGCPIVPELDVPELPIEP